MKVRVHCIGLVCSALLTPTHAVVLVGTCFYIIKRGSAEVLHHPVRMVSAVHARVGVGGSTGAIVVSSSDRSRLGCRVGVLTPGMVFGEVSACGEERDSSVVALGALVASAPDMDAGGWQSAPDSLHLASAHAVGETELFQVDLNGTPSSRPHPPVACCTDRGPRFSGCADSVLSLCTRDTGEGRSRTAPPCGAPHGAGLVLRLADARAWLLRAMDDGAGAPGGGESSWPASRCTREHAWLPMTRAGVLQGEVLYAEGEPVDTVFFVLEGSVGLQCQHPTKYDRPPPSGPSGVVTGANHLLCATARVQCCTCTTSTRRRSAARTR